LEPLKKVFRTERIWLKPTPQLRYLCHISKNLYNEANYLVRQAFFAHGQWVRANQLEQELRDSPNFQQLPILTAQKIIQLVEKAWKSFFTAVADWKATPEKYFQRPRVPKYKQKNGQFLIAFPKRLLIISRGVITLPSSTNILIRTRLSPSTPILGVRIVPQGYGYVLEILYTKQIPIPAEHPPNRIVGIDLGLTNLITMVNNIGKQPIVVKGGVVKSINQFFNKEQACLQQIYDKQQITTGKKLLRLTDKRNRKVANYFHEVSRFVIDWCLKHHIDTLILGHNKLWKQHVTLGRRTNQSFVLLPFNKLVLMLNYKAQDAGIRFISIREDYTSKCSFLDKEPIRQHTTYLGRRITRGLYCTSTGKVINSDVNGGYNIVKKAVPNAFASKEAADGIEGVWLHPVRWRTKEQPIVC
jgi:IS605 OrfB family transposase